MLKFFYKVLSAVTDIKCPFMYHLDLPYTIRSMQNTYCHLENLQTPRFSVFTEKQVRLPCFY